MAYETGTASGHIDLLGKLRTFLTENAELVAAGQNWTQNRWREVPDDSGQYELIVCGPGLSGDDEIYAGIKTYQDADADYYNWQLSGFLGFDSNLSFDGQVGYCGDYSPKVCLANFDITYWFIANGRRFIVVTKISTVYEVCHMGLILPYLPPTQLPYPFLCAGSAATPATRWSEQSYQHSNGIIQPCNLATDSGSVLSTIQSSALFYDGQWNALQNKYNAVGGYGTDVTGIWPFDYYTMTMTQVLRDNPDGEHTLSPLVPWKRLQSPIVWGEIDGCFHVSGFNNASENIIAVDGYNHLVIQNTYRTGIADYIAIQLGPTEE